MQRAMTGTLLELGYIKRGFFKMENNLKKELIDARSNIKHLPLYGKGGVFLDLGANIGEVSRAASKLFDKVISVEAHPRTFYRMLKRNKKIKNIIFINKGVAQESRKILYVSSPLNSTGATARPAMRLKNREKYYRKILSISFKFLLRKFKPRVIKMDIEGSEYVCLPQCKINKECEWISVEFHGTRSESKWIEYVSIEKELKIQNFKRIKPHKISMLPNKKACKGLYFVAVYQRRVI